MNWRRTIPATLAATLALASGFASAQSAPSGKVGFVNTDRVLKQSREAAELQKALDEEFRKRSEENSKRPPAEAERRQRAMVDELNQRRDDALKAIVEKANAAIKKIAEQDNLDVVLYEAAFAAPKVDLTDRVIKALDAAK